MAAYLETNIRTPATDQLTTAMTSTGIQSSSDCCIELSNDRDELVKSLHTTRGYLPEADTKCKENQDQIKKMETELTVLKNSDSALHALLDERENELDKLHQKDIELQREKDEKIKHQTERRQLKGRIEGLQEEERKMKLQGGIIQKLH